MAVKKDYSQQTQLPVDQPFEETTFLNNYKMVCDPNKKIPKASDLEEPQTTPKPNNPTSI